jgi:hypothetical protein
MEFVAGAGLLFDLEGSLSIISALLLVFIGILAYGIWMGLDVDCGCFGAGDPEKKAFHGLRSSLYRDLIMLAGAVFLYWRRRFHKIEPIRIGWVMKKIVKKREEVNV